MSLGSTSPTDEEVGLLDILLVLLENARLLIAVPLVASVLALVGVQFWPPVYESVAQVEGRKAAVIDGVEVDLFTPAQISALATARSTRELAFAKLQANGHGTLANMYEHAVISSTTPRNVSAVGVSVQAGSPVAAQQMLQAVVSSILEQTRPRGAEQERLQQNLDAGSAALARVAVLAWWWFALPTADALSADQVALLAMLLAAIGYVVSAAAAWGCASAFHKEQT